MALVNSDSEGKHAQKKPTFNVFGKGMFELEDFAVDGLTTKPVTAEEDKPSVRYCARNSGESRVRRAKDPPVASLGWPLRKTEKTERSHFSKDIGHMDSFRKKGAKLLSDVELMKERFAKLLLGEDMSGGGKGVSSALALSNAITNLAASVFGQLWRLEPLPLERKTMWCKEIEWFLSVTDYIVEFVPSYQNSLNGTQMEIMVTKPRSDLQMNIPALRKLDAMLLECLDKFEETEFWYADRATTESYKYGFDQQRQEDKWWLPIPRVPPEGLSDDARKLLQQQRESVNQIHKAAMAINAQVLSEMEIPDVYWEALPKNAKMSLGETMYRHITSENFSPEAFLSSLDLSSEHSILDAKNRIESSAAIWNRKIHNKDNKSASKPSWGAVHVDRWELLAERAETLLIVLKQRYPGLPQTTLDMSKIQYNKDVGQSILESYSRVLESLAFNISSRIDDVLHADDLSRLPRLPSESFERSPSTDSALEDQSSFGSFRSPNSPCIHPSPSSSPTNPPRNAPRAAGTANAGTKAIDSQTSMTLSDYMGWHGARQSNNDSVSRPGNHLNEPSQLMLYRQIGKSLQKLPVIISDKQRMSYIERLEKLGLTHSPASRD